MPTKLRTPFLLLLPACAAALLCGAEFSAHSASLHTASQHAANAAGWQVTKDTALGFAVERPAGWTVQADSRFILVQSRDETVLMEVFTAAPGDSATAHLTNLSDERAALFPQASVSSLVPQPSAGEEVSGTLHYQVTSPDKGMSVVGGDPRLPSTFQAPNAFTESTGMADGTNGLLHSMPASEFNRWYLDGLGRQVLDNLVIGAEHPMTKVSRQ